MCGICGIVPLPEDSAISNDVVTSMRESMVHRGPDDAGLYLQAGVALGSRRLSILDLSERGHMPMTAANGRYTITYNGEVYNFRELRSQLEARGYTFHSN